jgi:cell division septal protein FtsQ
MTYNETSWQVARGTMGACVLIALLCLLWAFTFVFWDAPKWICTSVFGDY